MTVGIIQRYNFNEHQVMEMSIVEYLNKATICNREIERENKKAQEIRTKYAAQRATRRR